MMSAIDQLECASIHKRDLERHVEQIVPPIMVDIAVVFHFTGSRVKGNGTERYLVLHFLSQIGKRLGT